MMAVWGDPEVMAYSDGTLEREQVEALIARNGEPGRDIALWALVESATREVIGYCGLTRYGDIGGRPEIEVGYRLARSCWGRGLATEAVQAVCQHASGSLGCTRLVALVDPDNRASARVARKAGFRYEKDAWLPGYDHADHLYVLAHTNGNSP